MTSGDEVFKQLQRSARSFADKAGKPAPTAEYLTRHGLESFLDRLTRTTHGEDFILKGGFFSRFTESGARPRTSTPRQSPRR